MSYGISLYNSKGEQFYDSSTTGSYMTLTKIIETSMSYNRTFIDTGVPEGVTCLCFTRDVSSGGATTHGLQVPRNGTWQIGGSASSDSGGRIRVYVFSNMTPPKAADYQYGVELYDSSGKLLIHNTAKPLVCSTFSVTAGGASFPYQVAITGSMLGFLLDPYAGPFQIYTRATGNNCATIRIQGGPNETIPYSHTTGYAIDISQYD